MRLSPIVIVVLLVTGFAVAQTADSLLELTFSLQQRLFHHPPLPFYKQRPYNLEVVVDIPRDSLESVSIFLKTDQMSSYQEVPLESYRGRYLFRFDPQEYPGELLNYFLVATTKGFRLYAVPLNKSGRIKPYKIRPLDPIRTYEPPE